MSIDIEHDWPKGADMTGLVNDWQLKLGPTFEQLFKEVGLPNGAVLCIEIKADE